MVTPSHHAFFRSHHIPRFCGASLAKVISITDLNIIPFNRIGTAGVVGQSSKYETKRRGRWTGAYTERDYYRERQGEYEQ